MVCPQPGLPGGPPGQAEDGDGDGDSLGVPEDPSAEHDPDLVDRLGVKMRREGWEGDCSGKDEMESDCRFEVHLRSTLREGLCQTVRSRLLLDLLHFQGVPAVEVGSPEIHPPQTEGLVDVPLDDK